MFEAIPHRQFALIGLPSTQLLIIRSTSTLLINRRKTKLYCESKKTFQYNFGHDFNMLKVNLAVLFIAGKLYFQLLGIFNLIAFLAVVFSAADDNFDQCKTIWSKWHNTDPIATGS